MPILPPLPKKQWTLDELAERVQHLESVLEDPAKRGSGGRGATPVSDDFVAATNKRLQHLELMQRALTAIERIVVPSCAHGCPGQATLSITPLEAILILELDYAPIGVRPQDDVNIHGQVTIVRAQSGRIDYCNNGKSDLCFPMQALPFSPLALLFSNERAEPVELGVVYKYLDIPRCDQRNPFHDIEKLAGQIG